jgi:Domain of unknown function (DUF1840)
VTAKEAMLYKFRSIATGEVIMTGVRGDQLLHIIGKPPSAKGIVAPEELPAAIRALERAVTADDASIDEPLNDRVSLRQRAWPLVDMFKRAQAAQTAVVWGV